ncbi:hypothetical protein [Clostridium scatologenes]|uniref:Replicative DNA helicase n=1 Tax=Clostridium scatologenes TaxID=1548 RepID=A0A0E3M9F3_CLOSL|nr:hypothetical protein [Clostridium scatologenes]AKA69450.1 hypothetical protein CSCA_2325 [Clostridium scatologenes]
MNENYIKTLNTTVNELSVRMKSLVKYYPFFKIMNGKYSKDEYENIDAGEVCMGIISFLFYEGKLKAQHITFVNIQDYLQMFVEKVYSIKLIGDSLYKFTNDTIDIIQNSEGRGFDIGFPIFMPERQNVKYVINKSSDSGIKEFELTPSAIDFFLETKEFGEESKITISLLILKKLIEHNEYESALISLTNVNAEVIKQIARVYEIEMALIYGGNLGYKSFLEYRELADKHQAEEEKLFSETMEQIRTLREDYATKVSKSQLGEKEINAFRCLDEMDKELNKTVELHQQLLGKLVILSKKANEILRKKKINLLRPSFDFSTYLDKLGQIGSAKSLEYMAMPFFQLNIQKSFALPKINEMLDFDDNSTNNDDTNFQDKENAILINTDKFNNEIRERVLHNYKYIINYFFMLLKDRDSFIMGDVIMDADEETNKNIFKNPDFIGLILDFLRLNEENVLSDEKWKKEKGNDSLEKALEAVYMDRLETYKIKIETIEDSYIEIALGFKMTNVIIRKV